MLKDSSTMPRRPFCFSLILAFLVSLVLTSEDVFSQDSQNRASTLVPPVSATSAAKDRATSSSLEGTGEQIRVMAAVCEVWEKARKNKVRQGDAPDSSDIRDYTFRVTQEGKNYNVTLWPKKPVIKKITTDKGVYLQNDSSTFFYTVRRRDFKIVNVSMVM